MSGWDAWPCLSALIATLAVVGFRAASKRSRAARGRRRLAWKTASALALLGLASAGVGAWYTHRPRPGAESRRLFQGITYDRILRDRPRPLVIHVVRVDLRAEGIRFLVTPDDPSSGRMLRARDTSTFLDEFGLELAVNANYYYPFDAGPPWDYYPRPGDPVDAVGLAASEGRVYSPKPWTDATVYLSRSNEVRFDPPDGPIHNAINGNGFLIRAGRPCSPFPDRDLYSRTALGLDRDRRTLIVVVVDGKQPRYSEGASLDDLAEILQEQGAHDAVRLDEGGSSTLVVRGPSGRSTLLNSPINARIPGYQRPVANHLGIHAAP